MSSYPDGFRTDFILGCGYLGRRIARRWLQQGRPVAAMTRGKTAELQSLGVTPVIGNVLEPGKWGAIPPIRTLVYAVGMDRTASASMHEVYVSGLVNVLTHIPAPERIFYISSTGVYGQTDGSEIDETAVAEPKEASGKIVREAELRLLALRPDATILRFAGIYGPDRLLRKQAILKGDPLTSDADKWLNLIHVDDGADAVLAAEAACGTKPADVIGEIFNISDGNPVRRREFYTRLAQLLGGPEAKFARTEETTQLAEPNRRIQNQKACERFGWQPRYPTSHDGLAAAVAEST